MIPLPADLGAQGGVCRGITPRSGRGWLRLPQGCDKTFPELPAKVKNTISHRARAMKELKSYLEERGE
ncbi:MAG: non-canonical purine NTP pyrophosphatase [Tissierellia bacterium]|nr:non-canonical purine NTP pyrophosphatase [Tissierellia bacterium]